MNTRSRSRAAAAAAAAAASSPPNTRSRRRVRAADRSAISRTVSTRIRPSGTSAVRDRAEGLTHMGYLYRFNKTRQLIKTERKLVRSCEHVVLLNDKIRGLTKRYQRARAEGFKSFRYNIRVRLAAVEGVRNMYYEYARDRAEEVAELRKELYDQNVFIIAGNDDSEEDTYSDMASSNEDFSDDDPMMDDEDTD